MKLNNKKRLNNLLVKNVGKYSKLLNIYFEKNIIE